MLQSTESDIVCQLLEKPFSGLLYQEKIALIKQGRLTPPLVNLVSEHKEKNRFYAGPACFFSNDMSPWRSGFNNLNYLVAACDKHQKSLSHIKAFSVLKQFGKQRIDYCLNNQKRISDRLHNEKVYENRCILKRLIDTVIFLGKQECPFRGHDETTSSSNRGMYVESLNYLSIYDSKLQEHLKHSTVFRGTSPLIQNDLIDAVASVVTEKIKEEIVSASFVAILLDETSDITNKSQLSTVFRYVDRAGHCQERFLFFTDVSADRTAKGLFEHVEKVLGDFKCGEKLIAQTFDGAAVMAGNVSGLQTLIKNKYPKATFIKLGFIKIN